MHIINPDTPVCAESSYMKRLHTCKTGAKLVIYESQTQKQLVQADTYNRSNVSIMVRCEHTCEASPSPQKTGINMDDEQIKYV